MGVTLGVYTKLLNIRLFNIFGLQYYVNAEAGTGRRPDVDISGQTVHAYILRYWYLVPLIKPPWAAGLYVSDCDIDSSFSIDTTNKQLILIDLLFLIPVNV